LLQDTAFVQNAAVFGVDGLDLHRKHPIGISLRMHRVDVPEAAMAKNPNDSEVRNPVAGAKNAALSLN
jgi:hypothetical protein